MNESDAYDFARDALASFEDPKWVTFDNDEGIVIVGPLNDAGERDVFLLTITAAVVKVTE